MFEIVIEDPNDNEYVTTLFRSVYRAGYYDGAKHALRGAASGAFIAGIALDLAQNVIPEFVREWKKTTNPKK